MYLDYTASSAKNVLSHFIEHNIKYPLNDKWSVDELLSLINVSQTDTGWLCCSSCSYPTAWPVATVSDKNITTLQKIFILQSHFVQFAVVKSYFSDKYCHMLLIRKKIPLIFSDYLTWFKGSVKVCKILEMNQTCSVCFWFDFFVYE